MNLDARKRSDALVALRVNTEPDYTPPSLAERDALVDLVASIAPQASGPQLRALAKLVSMAHS